MMLQLRFYVSFSVVYVLLGLIAYSVSPSDLVPPIFLPLALTVACLQVYGRKTIPGVAIGTLLLLSIQAFEPLQVIAMTFFEVCMAGLISFVILKLTKDRRPSENPESAIKFMAATTLLIWPIYAGLGSSLVCIFIGSFDSFPALFVHWWQGDVLTLFLASSIAILLSGTEFKPGSKENNRWFFRSLIPSLLSVIVFVLWSSGLFSFPPHLMLSIAIVLFVLMISTRCLSLFCLSATMIALCAEYFNHLGVGPLGGFEGHFWSFSATLVVAGSGWFMIIILKRHDIEIELQTATAEKAQSEASSTKIILFDALNRLSLTRDNETGNHILRTQHYVRAIARQLKNLLPVNDQELNEDYIDAIYLAAPLHDIGKVGIPDSILLKPGSLSDEEWETMKTHALIGENVLTSAGDQIQSRELAIASEVAGGHHERWDGSGYPRGLNGEEIPLSARIMAIADVYDALTTERVYKNAWTHAQAITEIKQLEGKQFDPIVVQAFMGIEDEIIAISEKFSD